MNNTTETEGGGELDTTAIVLIVVGIVGAMTAFASFLSLSYTKNQIRVVPAEPDEVFIVAPP